MKRAGRFLTISVAGTLSALTLPGPAGCQLIDADPATAAWQVEPVVQEHAVLYDADGAAYVGGSASGGGSCTAGSQAFLKKVAADGTEMWIRYGHALPDAACGTGGEEFLFDSFQSLDVRYVVFSSLHGLAREPGTGRLAVTGELFMAWLSGPEAVLTTARGAFAAVLTPDGEVIHDAYLGIDPDGPPAFGITCDHLCARAYDTEGLQYGGRGIAFSPNGDLAVTGWRRSISSDPLPQEDRDYFLALYDPDLADPRWIDAGGTAADDCGLAVAFAADGRLYLTGYGRAMRDVLLARYRPNGLRELLDWSDGPFDDEGREAEVDPDGNLVVRGRITDECDLAGMVLGAAGEGQKDFTAVFDADLRPISGTTSDPFGTVESASEEHIEYPDRVTVEVGGVGTGGVEELHASDDYHCRFYGRDRIGIAAEFDLPREPLVLREIRFEIGTSYCYTVGIEVRHLDSQELVLLGEKDVCPGDEPALAYLVSEAESRGLGIDGSDTAPLVLLIRLDFRFRGTTLAKAAGSTKDMGADQVTVKLEYDE